MSNEFLQFLCEEQSFCTRKLVVHGDTISCKARTVFKIVDRIACNVYQDKEERVNISHFVAETQSL